MLLTMLLTGAIQDEDKDEAKRYLQTVMNKVKRSQSFEAKIEHYNSSGIYPGHYVMHLRWKPGAFELKVVERKSDNVVTPNFYCRDGRVVTFTRDLRRLEESSEVRPNFMPGWEVAGGLNLSCLMQTPNAETFFIEPIKPKLPPNLPPGQEPKEQGYAFRMGQKREFQDERVQEIIVSVLGENSFEFSVFTQRTGRTIVGTEIVNPSLTGWTVYRDIKVNGPMPDDLGTPPGG